MSAMPASLPSLISSAIALGEVVRVDLVRQLGDDQAGAAALVLLDLDHGAHPDRAATGAVRVLDRRRADDQAVGREVRALDDLDQRVEGGRLVRLRVVQAPLHRRADLAQVVRRDLGGHADRDALGAVDQQVRDPRRQDRGLLGPAVVVVLQVDGVLVDVPQHLHGQRVEPALGVAHGGGRVVTGRAEVAVAVDQRVAQRPGLGHPDQGVVDRRVAVRVELTHHVADDAGALHVAAVRPVAAVEHRVEDLAVDRLEPVPDVRQRPPDDDAHRVVEVGALHLHLEPDRLDPVVRDRPRRVVSAGSSGSFGVDSGVSVTVIPLSDSESFSCCG